MPASKTNSIPVITNQSQMQEMMQTWRTALGRTVKIAPTPPPPHNFQAKPAQGGILLSWAKTNPLTPNKQLGAATNPSSPDGYELLVSRSGDFVSDVQVISFNDVTQTSYFYATSTPTRVAFKIHSTSGTQASPQSTFGPDTGTIIIKSLAATDTTTKPKAVRDNATTDAVRSQARVGRYSQQYFQTYAPKGT